MKQILKENGGLPASILWTLAIVAGISVANLYYNQPLLNMIRHELGVSEFETNLIAMVTQIGYALGLLFIVPLGDLYQRKRIILTSFSILIVSLLVIAMAPNIHVILCASLLTGICSVMPQIFIPIASQFSRPENKGRNVGIVVSGLLTGILASRVVSGFIGELFGWREMYYIAAECLLRKNDPKAADYFNAVLESRGLVALDDRIPAESLTIEKITQERYKEFVGEGQTFFNMKRLNLDIQAITGEILPAANSIYTVPVPEEEFNYRNEVYDVKQ